MPLQIPPFLYVPDICKIVGRSGINDSKDLFLLIAMRRLKFRPCGESPPTVPTFLHVPDICRIAKRSEINDSNKLKY